MNTTPEQSFDIPRILNTVGFPSLDENFINPILNDYSAMALFVALWTLILTSIIYMVYGLWLYSVYRKYKSSVFLFLLFVISGPVVGIAVGTPLGFLLGGWYYSGGYGMSPLTALLWGFIISMLTFLQAISRHSEIL